MVEIADPTLYMPDVVDYEWSHTWPRPMIELLDANLELLETYEHTGIDTICREDVLARVRPPQNHYQHQRDQIVLRADEILADERLFEFHCTKLADDAKRAVVTVGDRRGFIVEADGRRFVVTAACLVTDYQPRF